MTAAASTIEALMFSLRERGVAALQQLRIRQRLADLDDDQTLEVAARLQRLKSDIAPAWSDEDITVLFGAREGLR
jgi:hypothetical protein